MLKNCLHGRVAEDGVLLLNLVIQPKVIYQLQVLLFLLVKQLAFDDHQWMVIVYLVFYRPTVLSMLSWIYQGGRQ